MLVFTGYKPKRHNIETLGRRVSGCDADFLKVFPRATKEQDENFKLLKKAYIDARYKKDYKTTKKQLEYLAKRVKLLHMLLISEIVFLGADIWQPLFLTYYIEINTKSMKITYQTVISSLYTELK